jgi:hypothetical protein
MDVGPRSAIVATVVAVALLAAGVQIAAVLGPAPSAAVFQFSAAGDFGSWTGFTASLTELSTTASDFAIALGDLSYGGESEPAWCQEFKRYFDNVLLIAGNHDTGEPPPGEGNINAFAAHCPYPLRERMVGDYGRQYYFDYPGGNPIARFVFLSPDIVFVVDGGERYDYHVGTLRYNWTRDAIDGARAAGIPWVIVAMHKNCIAAGEHACEIGTDIFNLLLERKVDLIVQGHTHHYARSKQLALSPGRCAGIELNTFLPDCIADDGSDGQYVQGDGPVLVIAGIGGRDIDPFHVNDPYAGYFAAWQGDQPEGLGKGVVSFDVAADSITMRTHLQTNFTDTFTIVGPPRQPSPVQDFLVILGAAGAVAMGTAVAFVWRIGGLQKVPRNPGHRGARSRGTRATPSGVIRWEPLSSR